MKLTRLLSLLLALCLLLSSALLLTACKDQPDPPDETPDETPVTPPLSTETAGDFTYHLLADGTYAVSAAVGSFENGLTIPATYKEKAVTQVGYADPNQSGVYYGFSAIGDLTSVTFPASIKSIAPFAFSTCRNLANLQFAGGSQLTSIADRAFADCSSLSAVSLPSGVTTLGTALFSGCASLRSASLPASLTSIGARLFENCPKLLYITNLSAVAISDLPQNAGLEVRTSANADFTTTLTFDESGAELLTAGGKTYLFGYTGNESVLDLSALSFDEIYPSALAAKNITSLKLPASLTVIGESALANCAQLATLSFADNAQLTSIGDSAFEGCFALSSITLPEGLAEIGYRAFNACESLASLSIPASVTTIGSTAFAYCTMLSTVTIAENANLATIASQAFFGCEMLTAITYHGNILAWQAISKNTDWNTGTGEYTVTCTDGTVAKDGTTTMN